MHSGHFNAIRQAKALCDVLVVGVHSDDEITENKALPVMKQAERYALLEHVKWIDEILHDVPYSPEIATLDRARADFCVHGDDMPVNSQGVCAYDGMRDAGRLRIIQRTEGVSTTDLIGRLLTLAHQQHPSLGPDGTGTPGQLGVRAGLLNTLDLEGGDAEALSGNNSGWCTPKRASGSASPSPVQPSADPGNPALAQIDEMVAKYGMSEEDAARLRAAAAPPRKLSDGSPHAKKKGYAADEPAALRTSAPVQLLTSTRRIAEFATSKEPEKDAKIVYVCGSFDMFHVGHAQLLKEARELGTFLLVGIHDDATVARWKGAHMPVMNLTERVLNVCACKWADEVIIGAPLEVTADLIKTWRIEVVAKGIEYQTSDSKPSSQPTKDRFAIAKDREIYKEIPSKWPELCHETVVQRIMASRVAYVRRNLDRARREDDYYAQKGDDKDNSPSKVDDA
jgi:ethanolamine-phosphate cytidylyltransferase